MLDDPDHDHDSHANGDRPPRAVCIHDPLAITPADGPRNEGKDWLEPSPLSPQSVHRAFSEEHAAPRSEVLAALAKAEADEPDTASQLNDIALDLHRAREALCELAAVHPDFRRALDGWTTAGARMRHPETTPEVAPYSWIMRDLSSPDAVTRYTLARRRDNLVLIADAHNDRRRFRDLEGSPLPSSIEADELAAGDVAATPEVLADVERMLEDTAPEGHEVERVEAEQPPTVRRPARQGPEKCMSPARRIFAAADIARRYGGIEEAHHKQWVIDQMLRTMLGEDGYRAWVATQNADPAYDPWDVGITP